MPTVWTMMPFCLAMSAAFAGRHLACRVVAVGKHDQHLFRRRAVDEHLDGQADGVAQRGAGPAMPGSASRHHRLDRLVVERERDERIRRIAEGDQPDAVARPARDEIGDHCAYRLDAAFPCPGGIEEIARYPSIATGRSPASDRAAGSILSSGGSTYCGRASASTSNAQQSRIDGPSDAARAGDPAPPRAGRSPAASAISLKNGSRTDGGLLAIWRQQPPDEQRQGQQSTAARDSQAGTRWLSIQLRQVATNSLKAGVIELRAARPVFGIVEQDATLGDDRACRRHARSRKATHSAPVSSATAVRGQAASAVRFKSSTMAEHGAGLVGAAGAAMLDQPRQRLRR